MNPLDAQTPAALFGAEALADARGLKRVYARLVRAHPPEGAPEVFAHIRRLYEQAQAALDAPAPTPRVEVAEADGSELGTLVDGLTEDGFGDTIEALRTRARAGDADACSTGFLLLVAADPPASIPWLTALAHTPGAAAQTWNLLRFLFNFMPGRARDPALEDLFRAHDPGAGDAMRRLRIQMLHMFHPERAAQFFRQDLERLAQDGGAFGQLLLGTLDVLRWELSDDELTHLLHLTDEASLPLEDEHRDHLQRLIWAALAVNQVTDPTLLPARAAVRSGHGRSLGSATTALADLARVTEAPRELLARLDRDHPGVAAALYAMIEQVWFADSYLMTWGAAAAAPVPRGMEASVWESEIEEIATRARVDPVVGPPAVGLFQHPSEAVWPVLSALAGVAGMVPGLFRFFGRSLVDVGVDTLLAWFISGGVGLAIAVYLLQQLAQKARLRRIAVEHGTWDPLEDKRVPAMVDLTMQRAIAVGYWPHEVLGGLHRTFGFDPVRAKRYPIGEPAEMLAIINDAHVHRAYRADPAEPS